MEKIVLLIEMNLNRFWKKIHFGILEKMHHKLYFLLY